MYQNQSGQGCKHVSVIVTTIWDRGLSFCEINRYFPILFRINVLSNGIKHMSELEYVSQGTTEITHSSVREKVFFVSITT